MRRAEKLHTVLSLGAGVQSSALALMATAGEIGPMPDFAVFADTQAEPASVYRWLDWLEPRLAFPVIRASLGDLGAAATMVRTSKASGLNYTASAVPAFMFDGGVASGPMMRQCTRTFKIEVIHRAIRAAIPAPRRVSQWIGISTDEALRMKPSLVPWITNEWPLIAAGISRSDCLKWFSDRGFPRPPRSSCVFCPYHTDREWRRLKTEEPEDFARAVTFERELQTALGQVTRFRGKPFLHRSGEPLAQVDFSTLAQPDWFTNECEGICGV